MEPACVRGVLVVFSPDIRLVVHEKFAHFGVTASARPMKRSGTTAKYGITIIEHETGTGFPIGTRMCKGCTRCL